MADQRYAVWHPFLTIPWRADELTVERIRPHLLMVEQGKGARVTDIEGRSYITLFSAANVIGLGRADVAECCAEQLRRLSYHPLFAGGHPLAQELAEQLLKVAPPQFRMVFFCNDGSGAVETALKMARQYHLITGQPTSKNFIALSGAYHGASYGALSLTDHGLHALYEPMVPGCLTVPAPHSFHPPFPRGAEGLARRCAEALELRITASGPATIAAVVLEPVQSVGGVVPFPAEYFALVREITRRHGVLLIVDEVTPGLGRLGAWFGSSRWAIDADIMAVAKGLTSGYFPMGATFATARVYDAFASEGGGFPHAWTTGGHPAGCAVALAVLEIIHREGLVQNADEVGAFLLARLRASLADHPHVGDIRGVGLMLGVEIVEDKATKTRPSFDLMNAVVHALRSERLLVAVTSGVLTLYPLLCLSYGEAEEIVARLASAFRRISAREAVRTI